MDNKTLEAIEREMIRWRDKLRKGADNWNSGYYAAAERILKIINEMKEPTPEGADSHRKEVGGRTDE